MSRPAELWHLLTESPGRVSHRESLALSTHPTLCRTSKHSSSHWCHRISRSSPSSGDREQADLPLCPFFSCNSDSRPELWWGRWVVRRDLSSIKRSSARDSDLTHHGIEWEDRLNLLERWHSGVPCEPVYNRSHARVLLFVLFPKRTLLSRYTSEVRAQESRSTSQGGGRLPALQWMGRTPSTRSWPSPMLPGESIPHPMCAQVMPCVILESPCPLQDTCLYLDFCRPMT